jgi:hypothetical protein
VITTAYTFGWRMQSEVLAFERRQLDLKLGAIRLEPGTTKNNEWRLVYLTPELRSLMRETGVLLVPTHNVLPRSEPQLAKWGLNGSDTVGPEPLYEILIGEPTHAILRRAQNNVPLGVSSSLRPAL